MKSGHRRQRCGAKEPAPPTRPVGQAPAASLPGAEPVLARLRAVAAAWGQGNPGACLRCQRESPPAAICQKGCTRRYRLLNVTVPLVELYCILKV